MNFRLRHFLLTNQKRKVLKNAWEDISLLESFHSVFPTAPVYLWEIGRENCTVACLVTFSFISLNYRAYPYIYAAFSEKERMLEGLSKEGKETEKARKKRLEGRDKETKRQKTADGGHLGTHRKRLKSRLFMCL